MGSHDNREVPWTQNIRLYKFDKTYTSKVSSGWFYHKKY